MKSNRRHGTLLRLAMAILLILGMPLLVFGSGEEDLAALRRQVAAQQQKLAEQAEALRQQQEAIDVQMQELAILAEKLAMVAEAPQEAPAAVPTVATKEVPRDPVGDLNADAVAAGDFPGSIRIPGTRNLSLAIGGFVKTVAIADSDLEGTGATFLPASIGNSRPDDDGNFSIDATLTRLNLDARSPTPKGSIRGYIEWDLNAPNNGSPSFNLRHAYGEWQAPHGILTLGHTWSTLMDLQILPEGLTEPTVSGAIFQRQAQLRWSQPVSDRLRVDLALEDPSNRDVITGEPILVQPRLPDVVGAGQWDWADRGHVRVAGILRYIEIGDESSTGWGLSTGAHLNLMGKDKLAVSASYGKGIGRYLLGLPGTAGAFVDPVDGGLTLLGGWGVLATYRHYWSEGTRSTFALGQAQLEIVDGAPTDAFRRSRFGFFNLMKSVLPYLTIGLEYQYGVREEVNGDSKDNHRLIFGMQVF